MPVTATPEVKEAMFKCGKMAGLEVLRLLPEPVAGALARGIGPAGSNEAPLLVYAAFAYFRRRTGQARKHPGFKAVSFFWSLSIPLALLVVNNFLTVFSAPERRAFWAPFVPALFAAIDARPSIVNRAGAVALVPRGGAVSFQGVGFHYQADAAPTLSDVTMDVAAGAKIALVGPSGAGKSTIFNLLLRFYDVNAGTIAIDGQDIHGVTLESLRAAIGVVTQEAVLFDESVADNIALGKPGASLGEIKAAARNAAAHDFIAAMPEGFDTKVGEGGLKLSGGQRQRIAIARAMLRNAPILLLDEATSALDAESERQVQEALARLMKGRTTIVIAHRLSTVVDADRIYVVDKGRVAQAGSHAELLAADGLYASLYRHNLEDVR